MKYIMRNDENKKKVLKMYFEEKKTPRDIALEFRVSKGSICSVLKTTAGERYEKEKMRRIKGSKELSRKIKEEIGYYYYILELKPRDIANIVDMSPAFVTQQISESSMIYEKEREKRKDENKAKRTEQMIRGKSSNDAMLFGNMMQLQSQNAKSMSRSRKINDDGMVEMNINHYSYNPKKKRLELKLDSRCGAAPFGLPRTKKVHNQEANAYIGKYYDETFEKKLYR